MVDYAKAHAHARNTRRAYERAWSQFEAWCDAQGLSALPAAPKTIAAWLMATAVSKGDRPPARATLEQALAAIVAKHRAEGQPFDRKHPDIARTWRFLARELARVRAPRKAKALTDDDLLGILAGLKPIRKADARDGALLALGWGGALRRSELVALDWQKLGRGGGFVSVASDGITVTLTTSKGAQADAVEIVIPRADMPEAADAIDAWAKAAELAPGSPVFRSVTKGQRIGAARLTDGSVARIIKKRVRAYAKAHGRNKVAAEELAAAFSGHSLRRGYGTTAAKGDMPGYRIKSHMRHRSMDTTTGYIDEGEAWAKSGLKGILDRSRSRASGARPATADGSEATGGSHG
jgi:integrase